MQKPLQIRSMKDDPIHVVESPKQRLAKARILAVDDDPRNLMAIREVLEQTADVVCAQSGEEALRFLLNEEFAVILLDVLMPGLDGYETAKLIRKRKKSRQTPIIFLTAINKEDAHMLRGYDAGAVDYVFKPFDPFMLKSKVAVFVELFEKSCEIQQAAALQQQLMEEKLAAEQALRKSEQRQAMVLNALPVAVYVEGREAATRSPRFIAGDILGLTGFSEAAFAADAALWASRVHPDDDHAQSPYGNGDRGRDGGTVSEYRWLHADGGYRHFLEHAVFLHEEGQFAGTLLDISERRQLEDRLMQSQRLDAIGQLTGGLAHDFNNLLAAVLSGLGLLERRASLSDEAKQIVEMTRHSAAQGTEIVKRMLAFSRRQRLRPTAVHLDELAGTMKRIVASVLGGLIRLDWQVDRSMWAAHVDPGQLELALMNLVLNARDAMPSGGTIVIRGENRPVPHDLDDLLAGDYVVASVRDTGGGIPPEIMPKVMEPFFTTKPIGKGTGLGLSTVFGFAKQSGGSLRIDSAVGCGTTVELWLPRSLDEVRKPTPDKPPADDQLHSHREHLQSILLVDDSESLRELTARSLRHSGFDVTTAGSGAEALAIIERAPNRFDLIVTDFAMPVLSGLDVIRFARTLRADWPAIIFSGYADVSAIAERPRDVPLLSKPFTDDALLKTIRDLAIADRGKLTRPHTS
jgi:CheY-like chemotaxis protein